MPIYPYNTYTNWDYTSSEGNTNFICKVRPLSDPHPGHGYFWANQFFFVDGGGGYIGIQSKGSIPIHDDDRKIVIFSIFSGDVYPSTTNFDQMSATGPEWAGTFGGEGVGYSARRTYNWEVNHEYQFKVIQSGVNRWKSYVKDLTTGINTYIGQIVIPSDWGLLAGYSSSFTEFFSPNPPLETCADYGYAKAFFGRPTFNNGEVVTGPNPENIIANGAIPEGEYGCPDARIDRTYLGVVHSVGIPTWDWYRDGVIALNTDTINVPTHVDGDLLLLILYLDAQEIDEVATTLPPGWTIDFNRTPGGVDRMIMGHRVASSEPESYDIPSNIWASMVSTNGPWQIKYANMVNFDFFSGFVTISLGDSHGGDLGSPIVVLYGRSASGGVNSLTLYDSYIAGFETDETSRKIAAGIGLLEGIGELQLRGLASSNGSFLHWGYGEWVLWHGEVPPPPEEVLVTQPKLRMVQADITPRQKQLTSKQRSNRLHGNTYW